MKEIEELKEFINKEEREKEEKFEIFPDKISEVKKRVIELVMQKKQEQQLVEQNTIRQLLQIEAQIHDGLALGGIASYEPGHKDDGCLCEQGFIILQTSFNLASWNN